MLLVDEIDIDGAGVCHAKYQVKEDEFFCQGHFPGNPVVPGVIQCEIMAQSCALLVKDEIKGKTTLYTGIDNVRFKQIVKPGDLCEVTAVLKKRRGPLHKKVLTFRRMERIDCIRLLSRYKRFCFYHYSDSGGRI